MLISEVSDLIKSAYQPKIRQKIVYMLLGDPGVGKTQLLYEFAEETGCNVVTLLCSQQLPNEIVGTHAPDPDTGIMKYYPPAWYFELKDGDILFLDEMLTAPKSVLSAMLTLVQSRILQNRLKLPDVMILAAANPVGSPAQIDAPIRDRFQVVQIKTDIDVAAVYLAKKHGGNARHICNIFNSKATTLGATWNELTPRTVENILIQAKEFSDDFELTVFGECILEELYGSYVLNHAREWLLSVHLEKNKKIEQKAQTIDESVVKSKIREPIIKTVAKNIAVYDIPSKNWMDLDPDEVLEDLEEAGIISSDDVAHEVIRAYEEGLATGVEPVTTYLSSDAKIVIEQINEKLAEEAVEDWFEEKSLSDIIGTMSNHPEWENIRNIIESVKLFDVEVEE